MTHIWVGFGLVVFKVILGSSNALVLKIGFMKHLCNISITAPTAVIKQSVKVNDLLPKDLLFTILSEISLCADCLSLPTVV